LFHTLLCRCSALPVFTYVRNCDHIYVHLCICESGPNYFSPKMGIGRSSETSAFLYDPTRFVYRETIFLLLGVVSSRKVFFICIIYSNVLHTSQIMYVCIQVSQEECVRLQENVPYVKVHRCNPKHLYPKLNSYGDNGQRKVWSNCGSTYCTC
jgi:hypothetical protein